jgi:Flp pilus assembly CpaE family ATPase
LRFERPPLAESKTLDLSKLKHLHVNKDSNSIPQTTRTNTGTLLAQLHFNKTKNKDFAQVFCQKLKQRVERQQYERKKHRGEGVGGRGGAAGKVR